MSLQETIQEADAVRIGEIAADGDSANLALTSSWVRLLDERCFRRHCSTNSKMMI